MSGKRTRGRNDRYVEQGRVGEDGVRGGVEVCLHALEGGRDEEKEEEE